MTRHILTAFAVATALGTAAQTTNLVVEETNGTKTSIPTSQIAGVLFEDAPEYRDADYLLHAIYASSGENGTYTIELGTDAPDESGNPTDVGEMQVKLQLVATKSADPYEAVIPSGFYRVGDASKPFSININDSGLWTRVEEGSEGTVFLIFMDGSVDVKRNAAGEYDIRIEMLAMSGEPVNLRYQGPIKLSVAASEYESFTEDQNVTFTGGQERYYGNWYMPFADDALAQFYTGSFTAEGVQTEGYWLNIEAYFPKSDNPMDVNTPLPDGTYRADLRENVEYYSYNPFSFVRGAELEFMGQVYQTGTYLTLINKEGRRYIAHIRDGEFTVSDSGKKVAFDFTDENGNKITGNFDGNIVVGNFCDNADKQPARPYSTLKDNHTLIFPSTAMALVFQEPETLVNGYDSYFLAITDTDLDNPTKDYMQFTVLTEPGKGLVNGTYNVTMDFGANTVIPGRVDYGGNIMFSWYGDMDSTDPDGYQTTLAPIEKGSFTISDGPAEGTKTLTFDLYDDTDLGPDGGNAHKISGTWTGTMVIYNPEAEQLPALKPAR